MWLSSKSNSIGKTISVWKYFWPTGVRLPGPLWYFLSSLLVSWKLVWSYLFPNLEFCFCWSTVCCPFPTFWGRLATLFPCIVSCWFKTTYWWNQIDDGLSGCALWSLPGKPQWGYPDRPRHAPVSPNLLEVGYFIQVLSNSASSYSLFLSLSCGNTSARF